MDNIITISVSPDLDKSKKLFWAERDQSENDFWFDGEVLKSALEGLTWGYVENRSVYGEGIIQSLLESLERDENYAYFTAYTEDEILDEVADSWDGVLDYLFGRDPDLRARITVENAKRALAEGHKTDEDARVSRVMSALLGETVYTAECRGYSQGDYALVYYLLEDVDTTDADAVDDHERYTRAMLEAYLFGSYDVVELVDDKGDQMARAVMLDYTPRDLLGVGDRWNARRERAQDLLLVEVLGKTDAKTARVGRATARPYRAYKWTFTDADEVETDKK